MSLSAFVTLAGDRRRLLPRPPHRPASHLGRLQRCDRVAHTRQLRPQVNYKYLKDYAAGLGLISKLAIF